MDMSNQLIERLVQRTTETYTKDILLHADNEGAYFRRFSCELLSDVHHMQQTCTSCYTHDLFLKRNVEARQRSQKQEEWVFY